MKRNQSVVVVLLALVTMMIMSSCVSNPSGPVFEGGVSFGPWSVDGAIKWVPRTEGTEQGYTAPIDQDNKKMAKGRNWRDKQTNFLASKEGNRVFSPRPGTVCIMQNGVLGVNGREVTYDPYTVKEGDEFLYHDTLNGSIRGWFRGCGNAVAFPAPGQPATGGGFMFLGMRARYNIIPKFGFGKTQINPNCGPNENPRGTEAPPVGGGNGSSQQGEPYCAPDQNTRGASAPPAWSGSGTVTQ